MTTLKGLRKEVEEFGVFLTAEGEEQYGFYSPGFIINILAMEKELDHPDEDEIRGYLSGNLCYCSGYTPQLRAMKQRLDKKNGMGGDV